MAAALPTRNDCVEFAPERIRAQKNHRFDGGGYRCVTEFLGSLKRVFSDA